MKTQKLQANLNVEFSSPGMEDCFLCPNKVYLLLKNNLVVVKTKFACQKGKSSFHNNQISFQQQINFVVTQSGGATQELPMTHA